MRTAPFKPPCQVFVVTTSTVTPPAETASAVDPFVDASSSTHPPRITAGSGGVAEIRATRSVATSALLRGNGDARRIP
jgi:hypothetical protein